jgi:serine/threonine protein kinase
MKVESHKTANKAPTLEDLKDLDDRARARVGHPAILSWKLPGKPSYLLTVTNGGEKVPPTWILHAGDGESAAVTWIAMTTNLREILTKLKRTVSQTSSYALLETKNNKQEIYEEQPGAILTAGAIFAGKYEIISELGQGGMGIVYKARNTDTNDIIGLKVLHPHLLTDTLSRARFRQEAQKSDLAHRNLIRVHKYGFASSGQPFLAMEYLDGSPLSETLAKGPLSLVNFTSVFTQVCEGLYHAHTKGVIHRDIKPSNIMLCRGEKDNESVKIVDFGIAKSNLLNGEDKLTPTGEVLGSPLYMSPEQCAGGDPDPRSDIYSLGCVMYEAATGQCPFNHANPIKLILMQISDPPPAFSEITSKGIFSAEQERIIMKCLEKDPAKRYQTADDLGRDLCKLTVVENSAPVRSSGVDLRKEYLPETPSTEVEAPPAVTESFTKSLGYAPGPKQKKLVTFRFRKFRTNPEKDQVLMALDLSLRMIKRGADLSIYLDYEAVYLVQHVDMMAFEFHSDIGSTERIRNIQNSFHKIIRAGGNVTVPEQWLRYFGIQMEDLISGINVLDQDLLAEYLLQRTSTSIMDYT